MALEAELREVVPASNASSYDCASGSVVTVAPESILEVMTHLRDRAHAPFDMLVDVTAVDETARKGTIEVVYQLRSMAGGGRATVKASVPAREPVLPSVSSLWRSADWAEREVYDMFGVRFEGHPDLRRILMYPEFEGHPLLKAYPYQKRQPLIPERDPVNDPWPAKDLEPR